MINYLIGIEPIMILKRVVVGVLSEITHKHLGFSLVDKARQQGLKSGPVDSPHTFIHHFQSGSSWTHRAVVGPALMQLGPE